MYQCIIMRGPSGIGKSTWVKENYPDAVVCSADDYFWVENEGDGTRVYEFDPKYLAIAHSECLNKFINAIAKQQPVVIVDNTNTAEWEYINYKDIAMAFGYTVVLHEFRVETIDGLKELINRQDYEHGKQTPTEVICRMVLDFEPGFGHQVIYSAIEQQLE